VVLDAGAVLARREPEPSEPSIQTVAVTPTNISYDI
jgi:hypothetical protein